MVVRGGAYWRRHEREASVESKEGNEGASRPTSDEAAPGSFTAARLIIMYIVYNQYNRKENKIVEAVVAQIIMSAREKYV